MTEYAPLMEYKPSSYSARAAPNGDVTFRIKATNLGNGATRVTTTLKSVSGSIEALIPPSAALLESEAQSGEAAADETTLHVTVRAPKYSGYSNRLAQFQVIFTAKAEAGAAAAGSPVDETTMVLVLKVQGVSLPGFDVGPLFAGLGIAVAGIALRRRKG